MSGRVLHKIIYPMAIIFGLLICIIPAIRSDAITHKVLENIELVREDGEVFMIKAIHHSYGNNRYVSLRDMACALAGTDKSIGVSMDSDRTLIVTGGNYEPVGGEGIEFEYKEYKTDGITVNPISIDERDCMYFSFAGTNSEGNRDLYISITDLAMALNLDLHIDTAAGQLKLGSGDFHIDFDEYVEQGLYDEVYSALVGDAVTGVIYTSFNEDVSVCAASTTKLMTYLCVMDAVSAGEITLEDDVVISADVQALSKTSDGVIRMTEGQRVKLKDLLYAILLPSSNEAALALAEHIDGTEETFVKRMNDKAGELYLSENTYFYNCHGLPEYSDTVAASKIQNHITASDMFVLASHILNKYPEIRDITSVTEYRLEVFDTDIKNTNPLLYNLPGTIGLKTGTTKASGSSLVAAYDLKDESGTKTIVAIEYGAEDAATRNTVTEILMRYGIQSGRMSSFTVNEESFPYTADAIIKRLIQIKSRQR